MAGFDRVHPPGVLLKANSALLAIKYFGKHGEDYRFEPWVLKLNHEPLEP
jgi:hypothetical protein